MKRQEYGEIESSLKSQDMNYKNASRCNKYSNTSSINIYNKDLMGLSSNTMSKDVSIENAKTYMSKESLK